MTKKTLMVGGAGLLLSGALVGYLAARARAAIPALETLTYSGVLTDTAGVPLNGARNIQVQVWDQATDGNVKCMAGPTALTLVNGAFKVALPAACTTAVQSTPDLFIEVIANGESLGRARLGAVPYAIEASHAVDANHAVAADSASLSTPPTVVRVTDKRTGCPPTSAAGSDQIVAPFTLTRSTTVEIAGDLIRNFAGRADLNLILDGQMVTSSLTYTPTVQWAPAHLAWAGTLAAGAHTVSLRAPDANLWGCGEPWGAINVVIH